MGQNGLQIDPPGIPIPNKDFLSTENFSDIVVEPVNKRGGERSKLLIVRLLRGFGINLTSIMDGRSKVCGLVHLLIHIHHDTSGELVYGLPGIPWKGQRTHYPLLNL